MKKLLLFLFLALVPGWVLAQRGLFRGPAYLLVPNTATKVTVVVKYTTAPTSPTATIADLKYNKKVGLIPVKDDGGTGDWQLVSPLVNGGVGSDGVTYQPRRYDDGTGKLVDWHYTYALNWNYGQISNSTSAAQHLAIYRRGFADFSNHSLTHAGYFNRLYDIQQNQINLYKYFGIKPTTLTVPTSFEGFVEPWFALGKKLTASQGYGQSGLSSDDNQNAGVIWSERVKSNETRRLITTRRIFDDAWTNAQLATIKSFADTAFNASYANGPATKMVFQWFSHGPSYNSVADTNQRNNYIRFLDYVQNHPRNQGQAWIAGLQEFADYMGLKKDLIKSQTVSGTEQTITLDYTNVDPDARWRDVSLMVSGGTIASVTVTGADSSSYNPSTGLVNIYYRKTSGFIDPSTEAVPPELVSAGYYSGDASTIHLKYKTAVTQTGFAGYSVYTGALAQSSRNPPNLGTAQTISSISGSGTDWQLHLSSPLSASAVIDYRMQRGNAADASGGKVSSYIGMAVQALEGALPATGEKTLVIRQFGMYDQTVTINGVTHTGNRFAIATGSTITVSMTIASTDASKVLTPTPYPASMSGYTKTYTYTVTMDSDKVLDFFVNM